MASNSKIRFDFRLGGAAKSPGSEAGCVESDVCELVIADRANSKRFKKVFQD